MFEEMQKGLILLLKLLRPSFKLARADDDMVRRRLARWRYQGLLEAFRFCWRMDSTYGTLDTLRRRRRRRLFEVRKEGWLSGSAIGLCGTLGTMRERVPNTPHLEEECVISATIFKSTNRAREEVSGV
jgi:hypothetical protein